MHRLLMFLAILLPAMSGPATSTTVPTQCHLCARVAAELSPCLPYIIGISNHSVSDTGKGPKMACCAGVKDIARLAKEGNDRKSICRCIQIAMLLVGFVDPKRITELPKICGVCVNIPPIDKNFDCDKYIFLSLMHKHMHTINAFLPGTKNID
ncbi:hypothetical protein CsSME_00013013 [Camellia sinensis var. sinensis]|uniref:Non-specific lipid-transfer protein n=1 Tax=Camellia sinensis var. sinensis TaxID=542762 RepID=A0A4S4EK59_CAMSN|nr:hypothetical protein TEA_009699 [Camellia sinensis var. sinensis]